MSQALETIAPGDTVELRAMMKLWRVSVEAFIASAPRRRSERFLRLMSEKLAEEESLAQVFPIRPGTMRELDRLAVEKALVCFSRAMPMFVAAMREED